MLITIRTGISKLDKQIRRIIFLLSMSPQSSRQNTIKVERKVSCENGLLIFIYHSCAGWATKWALCERGETKEDGGKRTILPSLRHPVCPVRDSLMLSCVVDVFVHPAAVQVLNSSKLFYSAIFMNKYPLNEVSDLYVCSFNRVRPI